MIFKTPFFISLRYLRGKAYKNQTKRRMVGAIAAIAISLIPLLLVMQVAEGMIEGITKRYVEVGTFHLQVRTYLDTDDDTIDQILEGVREIEGVTTAFPVIEGTTLLYAEGGKAGTAVRALPPDIMERDPQFERYINVLKGKFSLEEPDAIIVSEEIADSLGVEPGDQVKILTAKTIPGRPMILRPSAKTVSGIFTTGYRELDALTVFIPLQEGKKLFSETGSRYIGVKTGDPYANLRRMVWDIEQNLPKGWYAYTWYGLEESMYKSLETTRNLLIFIMALILIVASVNISSAIVMIVMERKREIAIMKSIGGSPKMIRRIFLFTGLWIGFLGTVVGIAIGMAIVLNINEIIQALEKTINGMRQFFMQLGNGDGTIALEGKKLLNPDYYLEEIPINFTYVQLALVSGFSMILTLAASFFPSRRAGRMKPLDVLRRY